LGIEFGVVRPSFFTTKHTKATKVSGIDIFKLLNFVGFVTFVAKVSFSSLVAALPREYSRSVKPDEPEFLNASLSGGNVQESAAD